MSITIRPTLVALAVSALGTAFSASALADDPPCFYESRSGVNVECGIYHSEISNTQAFVDTVVKRGKWTKRSLHPVILDVRSTPEYKAGHPEHSYNAPWPFIYSACWDVGPDGAVAKDADGKVIGGKNPDGLPENDRYPDGACISTMPDTTIPQDVDDFVNYVKKIVPNKDTPIYTMCRTGVRSVGAANRLTDAGYTNVRNMWEGFVGVNLKAPQVVGYDSATGAPIVKDDPVDLNHDGLLTDADKNGWLYHLALPYDTRLLPKLIYKPRADTYNWD